MGPPGPPGAAAPFRDYATGDIETVVGPPGLPGAKGERGSIGLPGVDGVPVNIKFLLWMKSVLNSQIIVISGTVG